MPSNLFEQWINEIGKFLWDGCLRRLDRKRTACVAVAVFEATDEGRLEPGHLPAEGLRHEQRGPPRQGQGERQDFKDKIRMRRNYVFGVLLIFVGSFASQASEVASADVVICSYRLLYSQIYLNRRKER